MPGSPTTTRWRQERAENASRAASCSSSGSASRPTNGGRGQRQRPRALDQPEQPRILGLGRRSDQPAQLRPEQDLARRGQLLHAPGDCDRSAAERLSAHHEPARDRRSPHVDGGDRLAQLDRCPQRSKRVVLVRDRDAEDRHDLVAEQLLQRAAVPLDDRLRLGQKPRGSRRDASVRARGRGRAQRGGRRPGARLRERARSACGVGAVQAAAPAREDRGLDHRRSSAAAPRWLEADVVERQSRLLIGGERVDLPAGAVEREHLQPPQPLPCRFSRASASSSPTNSACMPSSSSASIGPRAPPAAAPPVAAPPSARTTRMRDRRARHLATARALAQHAARSRAGRPRASGRSARSGGRRSSAVGARARSRADARLKEVRPAPCAAARRSSGCTRAPCAAASLSTAPRSACRPRRPRWRGSAGVRAAHAASGPRARLRRRNCFQRPEQEEVDRRTWQRLRSDRNTVLPRAKDPEADVAVPRLPDQGFPQATPGCARLPRARRSPSFRDGNDPAMCRSGRTHLRSGRPEPASAMRRTPRARSDGLR